MSDSQRILDSIRRLVRLLRVSDRQAQADLGVSGAQLFVLTELGKTPGLSLGALAARTRTDQSSVSVVVTRLVEAGLITRDRDERDAQRLVLHLTRAGRALLQKAPSVAQERLLEELDRMPAEERRHFADTFEKIINRVGTEDGPAPMLFEEEPSDRPRRATRETRLKNAQPSDLSVEGAATTEGIPVAPDITEPRTPIERAFIDKRVVVLCVWSVLLAVITGFMAQALVALIGIVTSIAFYGRFSTVFVSPAGNHFGWLVVFIPAIGGLIVGVMARFGSKAIRGHGIPEAMEQVLLNESRIPARVTLLKPVSARSPSAPAARSAPKDRSSRRAARLARSSDRF